MLFSCKIENTENQHILFCMLLFFRFYSKLYVTNTKCKRLYNLIKKENTIELIVIIMNYLLCLTEIAVEHKKS